MPLRRIRCARLDHGRFHLREQSFHSALFWVTPIINHFESTRVLVPKLRTTLKDVEIEGSLPVISATAGTREEYALRSLTGESPQLLKDMEFFWGLLIFVISVGVISDFSSHALHIFCWCCAPTTITLNSACCKDCLVPPRSYGVMRGACFVEMSFPGG